MQKTEYLAELKQSYQLSSDTVRLDFFVTELAGMFQPGQFLEIETNGLLKRPFACMYQDPENDIISIGVKIVGDKSRYLSELAIGSKLKLFAPLGHGFRLKNSKKLIAVGGGSGIFALTEACRQTAAKGGEVYFFCGFRNENDAYDKELLEIDQCHYYRSSDMGGLDYHGNAVEAMRNILNRDKISLDDALLIGCGPKGMLRACKEFAAENNLSCQLSLEENMACGLGYCLGCAVDIIDENGKNTRVRCCVEGPVFDAEKLILS